MAILIKELGLQDYADVWHAMKAFTKNRAPSTGDELWFVEHNPVYTLVSQENGTSVTKSKRYNRTKNR